jgi:hypothetical protein
MNSSQIVNRSSRSPFHDHIDQLEVSNVNTIFPDINGLYNSKKYVPFTSYNRIEWMEKDRKEKYRTRQIE